MRLQHFIWTLFISVAAGFLVFVAVRQARANDALRGEADALRGMVQTLNTERAAREALVNLEPKAEEIKELSDNQSEMEHLRTEIDRLDAEIAGALKLGKALETRPTISAYSRLRSLLSAARDGRRAELEKLINLASNDRKETETLFARLPETARAQYPSAKHLVAAVVGLMVSPPNTKGVAILQERFSPDEKSVTYRLSPRGISPTPNPSPFDCAFRRTAGDDWLLMVSPEIMASYRQAVAVASEKK